MLQANFRGSDGQNMEQAPVYSAGLAVYIMLGMTSMRLFHIHTRAAHSMGWVPFQEGASVMVGENHNPYYAAIRISATRPGPGISAADIARSFRVMLREVVFEQVRRISFPDTPSRTTCLWACRTLDEARYWQQRIPHTGEKRIYELELIQGSIHEGSEGHLTEDSENISELEERAARYWNGAKVSEGQREILCAGKLNVVERHA